MARVGVNVERSVASASTAEGLVPGEPDLARALEQALDAPGSVRIVSRRQLKAGVFRVEIETRSRTFSVVAKRMAPEYARRNERMIHHWLPALGIVGLTPELLGIAASGDSRHVWHVYEDLGPWELDPHDPDPVRVTAVVQAIAELHSRAAAQPVLADCRLHGVDFGPAHLSSNVRDAIRTLEHLGDPGRVSTAEQTSLRDRLLGRLRRLRDEETMRARALADWSGPETLLHGDLWTTNTFAEPAPDGVRVRLIDWDRAGVGPASYDLSTFVLRFPRERRSELVSLYRASLEGRGWRLPGLREMNLLFETAECARYANRVIWPALALLRDDAPWGYDELAAVESWFEALEPVLPEERS